MLGSTKGIVELAPHSERWRQSFAEEAARIRAAIGGTVASIEHIGSTSILGIAAKPIVDISVGLEKIADGEKCIEPLENIGYQYRGEHGIAGRFYFVRGEPRSHHLHMVEADSDFWRSHLLFRDYLRENQAVAEQYEHLKKELAGKYAGNREAYQHGKTEFIENVLKRAGFRRIVEFIETTEEKKFKL